MNLQSHHNPCDCGSIAPNLGWIVDCDRRAIGDVTLQSVDYPEFWCSPFAILHGFEISSQFNLNVLIAARIGILTIVSRFGVDCSLISV